MMKDCVTGRVWRGGFSVSLAFLLPPPLSQFFPEHIWYSLVKLLYLPPMYLNLVEDVSYLM